MHLAVLLWGFTGVLGRAITLYAPVLVWYRMLLTAVFMAGILTFRKQWVAIARCHMLQLILVGCLMCLHWVAFYGAIKLANISIALVCLSTASIFTSLLDPLVNKGKYDAYELFLGLLALAGVYIIYRFQQFYGAGILSGIIAAILSSVFTVLNKNIASKYPARTMVFYEMSSGFLFLTLLAPAILYFLPGMQLLPRQVNLFSSSVLSSLFSRGVNNDWIWLIILSLCCTVWAQSLALNALKRLSSFTATLSVNLEPVYGILLAFLVYGENREIIFLNNTDKLNWGFISGISLILLSVALQMWRLLKPSAASPGYIKEKGGID